MVLEESGVHKVMPEKMVRRDLKEKRATKVHEVQQGRLVLQERMVLLDRLVKRAMLVLPVPKVPKVTTERLVHEALRVKTVLRVLQDQKDVLVDLVRKARKEPTVHLDPQGLRGRKEMMDLEDPVVPPEKKEPTAKMVQTVLPDRLALKAR